MKNKKKRYNLAENYLININGGKIWMVNIFALELLRKVLVLIIVEMNLHARLEKYLICVKLLFWINFKIKIY